MDCFLYDNSLHHERVNVKSLTYYFHMKTKISADFQICISVPLKKEKRMNYVKNDHFQNKFIQLFIQQMHLKLATTKNVFIKSNFLKKKKKTEKKLHYFIQFHFHMLM